MAYTYHPNAQTLFDAHLKSKMLTFHQGRLQGNPTAIPERTLWSYIVQIASAVKRVHDAGLAVRMIDVTKVLITGKNQYGREPGLSDLFSSFLHLHLLVSGNVVDFCNEKRLLSPPPCDADARRAVRMHQKNLTSAGLASIHPNLDVKTTRDT